MCSSRHCEQLPIKMDWSGYSAIQVTWTAPERPNGALLQYHIQLTSYDGSRVIASESVGNGTLVGQLDNRHLGKYSGSWWYMLQMCPAIIFILHYNFGLIRSNYDARCMIYNLSMWFLVTAMCCKYANALKRNFKVGFKLFMMYSICSSPESEGVLWESPFSFLFIKVKIAP